MHRVEHTHRPLHDDERSETCHPQHNQHLKKRIGNRTTRSLRLCLASFAFRFSTLCARTPPSRQLPWWLPLPSSFGGSSVRLSVQFPALTPRVELVTFIRHTWGQAGRRNKRRMLCCRAALILRPIPRVRAPPPAHSLRRRTGIQSTPRQNLAGPSSPNKHAPLPSPSPTHKPTTPTTTISFAPPFPQPVHPSRSHAPKPRAFFAFPPFKSTKHPQLSHHHLTSIRYEPEERAAPECCSSPVSTTTRSPDCTNPSARAWSRTGPWWVRLFD